jgi:hypothetical protein
MWTIPASVTMQVYDVITYMDGSDLRWSVGDLDINKLLNG